MRHLRLAVLLTLPLAGCAPSVAVDDLAAVSTPDAPWTVRAAMTLTSPVPVGFCMTEGLPLVAPGEPACAVVEVRSTGGACVCDPAAARAPIEPTRAKVAEALLADPFAAELGLDCACEIPLLAGAEASACRETVTAPMVNGVEVSGTCYVAPMESPPLGDPALITNCPDDEPVMLRFVGKGLPSGPASVAVACRP